MRQRIKAIFHEGAFIPQVPLDLPENSEVELTVYDPYTVAPEVESLEEKARILREVVESMRGNPIPADAPLFTRENLYEWQTKMPVEK